MINKLPKVTATLTLALFSMFSLANGYQLSPNENALLDALLKDDAAVALSGGESMLEYHLPASVSAIEASKTYEDNQVAGDQKYFNKPLLLTGTITGIYSGLGNVPYIGMKGKNQFLSPQVHFDKPNMDKIVQLKKGQEISFVCTGAGAVAGTPMFKNCEFAEVIIANKEAELKNMAAKALTGEALPTEYDPVKNILLASITMARFLPKDSECFSKLEGKKCQTQLALFGKDKKKTHEAIMAVHEELKTLGVDTPTPTPTPAPAK